jgi:hypothetical protein
VIFYPEVILEVGNGILEVFHLNYHRRLPSQPDEAHSSDDKVLDDQYDEDEAGGAMHKPDGIDTPKVKDKPLRQVVGMEFLRYSGDDEKNKNTSLQPVLDDPVLTESPDENPGLHTLICGFAHG